MREPFFPVILREPFAFVILREPFAFVVLRERRDRRIWLRIKLRDRRISHPMLSSFAEFTLSGDSSTGSE